jgi:hypothetical protein
MFSGFKSRWTDAFVVRGRQSSRDLHRDIDGLLHRHRAAGQSLPERGAFEQLRHDIRDAVARAEIVNREDVGVRKGRHRLRLAREPCETVGVTGYARRQNLDGDESIEPRVPGAIDLAHATGADRADDLIRSQLGAGASAMVAQAIVPRGSERVAGRFDEP